jgi:hypothetical protein
VNHSLFRPKAIALWNPSTFEHSEDCTMRITEAEHQAIWQTIIEVDPDADIYRSFKYQVLSFNLKNKSLALNFVRFLSGKTIPIWLKSG